MHGYTTVQRKQQITCHMHAPAHLLACCRPQLCSPAVMQWMHKLILMTSEAAFAQRQVLSGHSTNAYPLQSPG